MHAGLGDIFDDDRNVKLPDTHRLVVRCTDEASVLVDKGNRVDRAQMLVVLLNDVPRVGVKLVDFLVGTSSEENMLLVRVRVEADTVRDLVVGRESRNAFARFRVPQLDHLIITRRQKPSSIIVESNVSDTFRVAVESPQAAAVVVNVPQLDFAVHTCGEQQVAAVGEKADGIDAFCVTGPEEKEERVCEWFSRGDGCQVALPKTHHV